MTLPRTQDRITMQHLAGYRVFSVVLNVTVGAKASKRQLNGISK
ncbi:MAG TPA: hypothetical protein VE504_05585 [Nitrososphaeraceae archaeon]|nr:hypothetical protein [Nitrososphaeraceae archaeon]